MTTGNYHRFYACLSRLHYLGDEEAKDGFVSSFTDGRTTHLHEMTEKEYDAMCSRLEEMSGYRTLLKKARSVCLHLMQKCGIDTTDWGRVNDFCSHPRIAGKVFYKLDVDELRTLSEKIRAIERKGGLKKREESEIAMTSRHTEPQHTEPLTYVMAAQLSVMGNA